MHKTCRALWSAWGRTGEVAGASCTVGAKPPHASLDAAGRPARTDLDGARPAPRCPAAPQAILECLGLPSRAPPISAALELEANGFDARS
jgi:hypothetical protein